MRELKLGDVDNVTLSVNKTTGAVVLSYLFDGKRYAGSMSLSPAVSMRDVGKAVAVLFKAPSEREAV